MTNTHPAPLTPDPIEANLSPADDRVRLNNWLPPQVGVVPKIRIGQRWINVLWVLPLGFVLAVIGVMPDGTVWQMTHLTPNDFPVGIQTHLGLNAQE